MDSAWDPFATSCGEKDAWASQVNVQLHVSVRRSLQSAPLPMPPPGALEEGGARQRLHPQARGISCCWLSGDAAPVDALYRCSPRTKDHLPKVNKEASGCCLPNGIRTYTLRSLGASSFPKLSSILVFGFLRRAVFSRNRQNMVFAVFRPSGSGELCDCCRSIHQIIGRLLSADVFSSVKKANC